jgi:spore photoproduct lyase
LSVKAIKAFSVDRHQASSPAAQCLRRAGKPVDVVEEAPRTEDWRDGKRQLHLAEKKGEALRFCASMHPDYICCSVRVLDAVSNCPFDCTYCFLQSYLTDTTLQVVADVDALVAEVRETIARQPRRLFRIGTWELGDSLALEPLTGTAAELVRAFAGMENAVLELRTKSDAVDGLLDLPHGGRTVVGWTLSPAAVVRSEELGTASTARRLDAMSRVARAGYPVSVHFDPIVIHDGWEGAYDDLVAQLFAAVPADRVAWISMGALRFNPEMKKLIVANYPKSKITTPEMVLGDDGKVRYVKPLRLELYHRLLAAIRSRTGGDDMVYLCMERWDVWRRVFGSHPQSSAHLDFLFAESLLRRFPGLVPHEPDPGDYEHERCAR